MSTETSPHLPQHRIPDPPLLPPSQFPVTPEAAFAQAVIDKMTAEGRKWAWLADQADTPRSTLRSQFIEDPSRLRLAVARRVATALDLPMFIETEAA